MIIACKCLNFIATSPQLQRMFIGSMNGDNLNDNNNINDNAAATGGTGDTPLRTLLSQVFVQKFPRDFVYYSKFTEFFKYASGPVSDLTVNSISQRDLIYSVTLERAGESWQLSVCINCKVVLCAKRLIAGAGATPTDYLINCTLLCSNEALAYRRTLKSYSETFELLIMDPKDAAVAAVGAVTPPPPTNGIANSTSSLSIGSVSANGPLDGKLQRLRQLQAHQQARLQDEINETNERIERYTEQNFALLKSFREKSDQEGALLARLIQQLPEQSCELMDRGMPVDLEVTGGGLSYATGPGARRRNTISSRRELGVPTSPSTPLVQPRSFLSLMQDKQRPQQQQQQPPLPSASIITTRKMSNFDTPPATPEATPMSVGNSPTFRQQQQQLQQQQATAAANNLPLLSTTAASTAADDADDCLFDLEDVDGTPQAPSQTVQNLARAQIYQQQQQQHYQRLQQLEQQQLHHHQHHDSMSDADEAEDALDLNSSLAIPVRGAGDGRAATANMLFANFARSLPVEIANSPLAERANNNNNNHIGLEDEEALENNVDIAASIKALAKSVHGEAVFGDLPRPRLHSQF